MLDPAEESRLEPTKGASQHTGLLSQPACAAYKRVWAFATRIAEEALLQTKQMSAILYVKQCR